MRACVTSDAQPASTTGGVIPEFLVWAGRVAAQIHLLEEVRLRIGRFWVGSREIRITQIGELAGIALTAEGTLNTA